MPALIFTQGAKQKGGPGVELCDVTLERLAGGTGVFVSPRHRFGTDAMLLSAFCNVHRGWLACDLGTGCGIVPLRWHDAGHRGPCYGVELDAEGAELLALAAKEAGAAHITALQGDLRALPPVLPRGQFHVVSCNPPYFTGGFVSQKPARGTARHELTCTAADVCGAAAQLLRDGGRLCVCNRPARLTDLMVAMRQCGIEPKRLRFVRRRPETVPWLFLLDGRKAASPGLALLPDLYMEQADGSPSAELLQIYQQGGGAT